MMHARFALFLLAPAVALSMVGDVFAATNVIIYGATNAPAASVAPSQGLVEVFIRTMGALLIVIALVLAAAWAFRRSKLFGLVKSGTGHLRVLESKSLGARHTLHVVEYGEQRFLIADTPAGTNLIAPVNAPAAAAMAESAPAPGTFAEKLRALLDGKK
ncbi:MAG: hypothetical protein EXS19_02280 [Pedosphaera sp.]|nr:hypothetical protein [Pedosphaera sp.]